MSLNATESVTLVELWASVKNYVPAKDQRDAAEQYIATIDEAGLIDFNAVGIELYGVCDTFDKALRTYIQEQGYRADENLDDWDE